MSAPGHKKNPGRVASGLKASINNPNVSEEAKDRARERLSKLGLKEDTALAHAAAPSAGEDVGGDDEARNKVGGVSVGTHHIGAPAGEEGETEHRVLGGYKATLHNPRVSDKAKDHARHVLEEHDAL